MKKKNKRKVVLVGHIYETDDEKSQQEKSRDRGKIKKVEEEEMGRYLLSIPKGLRRDLKYESDERGFGNVSVYICHILRRRRIIFFRDEARGDESNLDVD